MSLTRRNFHLLPHQIEYLTSEKHSFGLISGIGAGKTYVGALGVYIASTRYPEGTVAFGAPTFRMLRKAAIKTFETHHDEWGFDFRHNVNKQLVEFTTYLSCGKKWITQAEAISLNDPDSSRGNNLLYFWQDEPSKSKEYSKDVILGRLRVKDRFPIAYRVTGSPNGFDWVQRYFIGDIADAAENKELQDELIRQRGCITDVSTHENKFLSDQYIRTLKTSYSESLYRQEVLGQFVVQGQGRIYSSFDRRIHISKDAEYVPGMPIILAWDFNVLGSCMLAHADNSGIWFFDEVQMERSQTDDVCKEILARYWHKKPYSERCREFIVCGDATGTRHGTRSNKNDYDIINANFIPPPSDYGAYAASISTLKPWGVLKCYLRESNPSRTDRYAKFNTALKMANGESRVKINKRCVRLIRDLEEVSYKTGSNNVEKDHEGKLTHLSDAAGYLIYEAWPGRDLSARPRMA